MPRHGGTRRVQRNKHQGHRMHRKARGARSKAGRGRKPMAWGRGGL